MQDTSTLRTVHTNGLLVQKMGGVRVVITSLEGDILKYGVQLQFLVTNNEAEYKVILTRLRVAKSLRARNVLLKRDSKLVIRRINGEYNAQTKKKKKKRQDTKVLEADKPNNW